jgi:hypothetical protein
MFCAVYGTGERVRVKIKKDTIEDIPHNMLKVEDPFLFFKELYFRKVSDGFLKGCVDTIIAYANGVRVPEDYKNVRVLAMKTGKHKLRILIANDSYTYVRSALIDTRRKISRIRIVTPFPPVPIKPEGSAFRIRIPNRGMVIVDTVLEGKKWE